MPTDHGRPRVFVSSTIRDFADLRSALRYWLAELGLDVWMSEFNDVERQPEQGTFESCFTAIAACDYYILLVGGCKGGEYQAGVSVTQQEYRTAADLADRGKIKPVIFVRADVLREVRDRERIVATVPPDHWAGVWGVPSDVLHDAEFVASFLHEIATRETPRTPDGEAGGSRWIYRFVGFQDVVDALQVNLRLSHSVRRQVVLANLTRELAENLTVVVSKHDDRPLPWYAFMDRLRAELPIPDDPLASAAVPHHLSARIAAFSVAAWGFDRLRSTALHDAISSGEFLLYDQQRKRMTAGEVQSVLQSLREAIDRCRRLLPTINQSHDTSWLTSLAAQRQAGLDPVQVPGLELTLLYALRDAMRDVYVLSKALLDYAEDPSARFTMPTLSPSTPIPAQEEAIKAERPTVDEVLGWLRKGLLPEE